MEKPKKVKIPAKGKKTGAQRDLAKMREMEKRIETLESLLKEARDLVEERLITANALQVENHRMKIRETSLEMAVGLLKQEVLRLAQVIQVRNSRLGQEPATSQTSTSSSPQKIQESGAESDPSGKSSHEAGAKLDAGKLRAGLVLGGFSKALKAVTEVGTFGANKYTDNGWRSVHEGAKRYEDALWRHLLERGCDEQSGLPHRWHALWNMMALIELDLDSKQD